MNLALVAIKIRAPRRFLSRLLAWLRPKPAPTRVVFLSDSAALWRAHYPELREGQEVWGASRSPRDTWRLIGPDESPLRESWMPRESGLSSWPRGLRDETAGDVPAVSPPQGAL